MKEETYQLLDDLYSEVCPLLPFEMFNVCCDETQGLGTGPSKDLAAKIGVAGVYVRHVRRVHDLLRDRYHKRMMMWGDIIVQHPDRLVDVPKDTVMLAWDYDGPARLSVADQPFAKAGSRILRMPRREQLEPHRARLPRPPSRTSATSSATASHRGAGHDQHIVGRRRRGAQGADLARPRLGGRVRLERLDHRTRRRSIAASGRSSSVSTETISRRPSRCWPGRTACPEWPG